MVKSKSAGYICPSVKQKKVHRFSLAEESFNDGESLLLVDCESHIGKYRLIEECYSDIKGISCSYNMQKPVCTNLDISR